MVLVPLAVITARLDTLSRGRSPAHPNVNLLNVYGLQVYFKGKMAWSTKDFIIRNPPRQSILNPTEYQKAIRYMFGYIARNWQNYTNLPGLNIFHQNGKVYGNLKYKGRKLPQGAVAPAVAAVIQAKFKEAEIKLRSETEAQEIRKKYRKGWHTYEEFAEALTKSTAIAEAARRLGIPVAATGAGAGR